MKKTKQVGEKKLKPEKKKAGRKAPLSDLKALQQFFNAHPVHEGEITLLDNYGLAVLFPMEIVRLSSDNMHTTIHFLNGQKLVLNGNMKKFEEVFSKYHFYRVHNQDMVNMDYVTNISRLQGGLVTLITKDEVRIARSRVDDFIIAFCDNLQNLRLDPLMEIMRMYVFDKLLNSSKDSIKSL